MTITLNTEQERIIRAEIDRGRFRTVGEMLDHALAALRAAEQQHGLESTRKNLAQFLLESPLAGAELNLERQKDYGRDVDL